MRRSSGFVAVVSPAMESALSRATAVGDGSQERKARKRKTGGASTWAGGKTCGYKEADITPDGGTP